MLAFRPHFRPGHPVYSEVVYAVKKALVSGALQAGDLFPSVRQLSQELRINPNTAHKIVGELIQEGILEVRPGIGTTVSEKRIGSRDQRRVLLEDEVERLAVQAWHLSLSLDDLTKALASRWKKISRPSP